MTERSGVHCAGFGMACCYSVLTWVSQSETGVSLSLFYACIAIAAFFYFWPLRFVLPQPTFAAVIGWAIVFRILGFIGEPFFEDDFYRYLWDGYQLMVHGNPYLYAPEAFFNDPDVSPAFHFILGNINYPEIPTVYGPSLQFLFGLSYWIAPAELWPLKAMLIGFDLLLIGLLTRIGTAKNILLYAWNPLVIKEIAFTGHIDGLVPLLLIAAWFCQQHGRLYWMAILLGLATTVKIPALLFAPFLLWRTGWKPVLFFSVILLLCYLPFIGEGGSDFPVLFRFAQGWQFNSALYGLLKPMLSGALARYLLGVTVIFWIAWLWFKHQQSTLKALPRGDLIFAGLIFAAPAINPWYWIWVLPFSVIYPSRWVWVASFALLLSYITGLNLESQSLEAYQQPIWLPWIEFGVIASVIGWEYRSVTQGKHLWIWRHRLHSPFFYRK